jgi:hypothetical protein
MRGASCQRCDLDTPAKFGPPLGILSLAPRAAPPCSDR